MSWAQLAKIDFLGTSPFQNLCCHEIRKFLPELEFVEFGDSEKVFSADVPSTDLHMSLYFDSVVIESSGTKLVFNSRNFEQPEDLVARLIAELSNSI